MTKHAQLPDGTILEFPDETPDNVMDGAVKAHITNPPNDSALKGVAGGAWKPIDNLVEAANSVPALRAAGDFVDRTFGLTPSQQTLANHKAARANNSRTGWQTVGNIAGTLPTTALPGGPLVQGAASGALLTDKTDPVGIATDMGIGAAGSKIVSGMFGAASKIVSPKIEKGLQALHDAGVPLTIGQIASQGKSLGSNIIAGAEEKLSGFPLIGDIINSARNRSTEGFNIALGNRVLGNVGAKLPKGTEAGGEMVDYVGKQLSDRYGKLVPQLVGKYDQQFTADLAAAKAATRTLPKARQGQFANIVQDIFANRSQNGQISGQALKDAESRLSMLVKTYKSSTDADQKIMGEALDQTRQALRGMVMRANPQHAQELQALNKGWAQLGQLRTAANAPGNATGVITPAQALSASRKNGFSDQFVKYAKATLPNKTPDSGTAGRAATGWLLTGGTGAAASMASPYLAAPAAGSLLYTKAGQNLVNKLVFAPRGRAMQMFGSGLDKARRFAPVVVPPLLARPND